ncbi:MAG: cytochrome c3 family protein, partial [Planctomycetes bacterium]|nr:cytochrome c3 family protein [Planctomycetota bacterium]
MHGPEPYNYELCSECHPRDGIYGRRQIVGPGGDFDQASVHVSGEVEDDDCVLCHDVSQHQQGVVRMIDPDSGGTAPWIGTGTGFCLSCHDGDPPIDITFPAVPKGTGYDKSAFMGTTHENMLGDQSCQQCHNSHGAPNISLLKNKYIIADNNVWTEGDGDYAACWTCHDENAVVIQENAFEKRHDKHVNDEESPCFICHDMHAPFDAGELGLINFQPSIRLSYDIQFIDGRDASSSFFVTP